ncbi:MAG: hypothetical protein GVY35_06120 [Bacteroidetes bacterium]|jgi:hypothetical protein|nr:hypothetical protein [Bacteroidota bacterium]
MYASSTTNPTPQWTAALQRLALFVLVPAFIFLTGCDSSGSNGEDPPPEDPFSVAAYDTSDAGDVITVSDVEGGGIGYTDIDGNEVTDVTWESDIVYELDGFVFVNDGQTLTIEPGTMIKGLPGSGEDASALIVSRGGAIIADGNPGSSDPSQADPIIFTAEADDGSGLGPNVRGEWGGVILLGDASLNSQPGETSIEGVPSSGRTLYGGSNDDHDIGTFRFVSIRHTGTQLGNGDEIQGLTLGGVGSGSTIEYVESYASDDDGYEWFGGTVNTKHLIAAWAADDSYDMDEGYRGSNQFWLAVQAADAAGRAAEMDGGTDPETGTPIATPKIANATYIGIGPATTGTSGDANDPFVYHRDNNASSYFYSVFMDGGTDAGLHIEDLNSGTDSRDQWDNDLLRHENNLWWNIGPSYDGSATTFEDIIQLTTYDDDDDESTDEVPVDPSFRGTLADYLRNNGNELLMSSPVTDVTRNSNGVITSFNPLAAGDATGQMTTSAPSGFGDQGGVNANFVTTDYYGAFGDTNWAAGWTLLSQTGELVGQ